MKSKSKEKIKDEPIKKVKNSYLSSAHSQIIINPSDYFLTFIFTRVECLKCGHNWRVRSIPFCCPRCHCRQLNLLGYEVIEVIE